MPLKEAYENYKNEFPEVSVGLSNFCFLRPFHVKLFNQIPFLQIP